MSASRPTGIMIATSASRYAFMAQSSVSVDASRSSPISGNATASPKKSRVSAIITPDIATTAHHLRFAAFTDGLMLLGRYP
jgi:hypothetical protein